MAEIVVERSPLAEFLDEMPSLIMQYKQMQMAQEERALDREERKAQATQSILLKEYYDMKDQVRATEKMYDKYDNVDPSFMTQGAADIISIVDEQNSINMNAITQNLNTLSEYQSSLDAGLSTLRSQASTLKEMQSEFAGANRVLDPHEYEAFQEHALTALEEGGLGWETTAGADQAYFSKDPTQRFADAVKITNHMKAGQVANAESNYGIIQGMYTLGEGEDSGDLVERLTYTDPVTKKKIEPSEELVQAIQLMAMQPYGDFMSGINSLPGAIGDAVRTELSTNKNTSAFFLNLSRNYDAINALDSELAGINETNEESDFNSFVEAISGVDNKNALFAMYDQAVAGMPREEHGPYFNAMEAAMGGSDLYDDYLQFKGLSSSGVGIVEPEIPTYDSNITTTDFNIDESLQKLRTYGDSGEVVDSLNSIESYAPGGFISTDRDEYIEDDFEKFLEEIE